MLDDLVNRLVIISAREGDEVSDPLTGEPVNRWRTELSPAARERLTRAGLAVRAR